jgi:hypothetical protein
MSPHAALQRTTGSGMGSAAGAPALAVDHDVVLINAKE